MSDQASFNPHRFGRFALLERIGRGGMAEVFRAKTWGPAGFEKELALKQILPSLLDDAQFVSMFIDEARLTAQLVHPNIVQVHELGEIDGQLFTTMEFVPGKDLLDLLARCARRGRRIPVDVAIHIACGLLKGLDFAHEATDAAGNSLAIIHRDVSPSNVLLAYVGHTKVSDFGIAKSHVQSQQTLAGTQKGKVGYMSPEQVIGAGVTRQSDLFAAGVILYEILTMRRLFKAPNDLDVLLKIRDCDIEADLERLSDVPIGLQEIVRHALGRAPEQRYASAAAFHSALMDLAHRSGLRPEDGALATFLSEMFADRIAEERRTRARDAEVLQRLGGVVEERARWRYRDHDGRIHGPMTEPMLRELLASRGVEAGEALSSDGGPWLDPADHAVLGAVERAPARPAPPPPVVASPAPRGASAASGRQSMPTPVAAMDSIATPTPLPPLRGIREESHARYDVEPAPEAASAERSGGVDWETLGAAQINPNRVRRKRRAPPEAPVRATRPPPSGPEAWWEADIPETTPFPREVSSINNQSVRPILELGPGATPSDSQFGEPTSEGDLARATVARILYGLVQRRATGLLALNTPDENRAIFLDAGEPTLIESTVAAELLGNLAIERGLTNGTEVRDALHFARRHGIRIGDALVRRGAVPPQQLFHLLTEQMHEKLAAAMLNVEGQWRWWEGATHPGERLPARFDVVATIIATVMERFTARFLRNHFERRGRSEIELAVPRNELSRLALATRVLRVASESRDGETVAELVARFVDRYRWREVEVLRALYLLTEFQVLRYRGEPQPVLPA